MSRLKKNVHGYLDYIREDFSKYKEYPDQYGCREGKFSNSDIAKLAETSSRSVSDFINNRVDTSGGLVSDILEATGYVENRLIDATRLYLNQNKVGEDPSVFRQLGEEEDADPSLKLEVGDAVRAITRMTGDSQEKREMALAMQAREVKKQMMILEGMEKEFRDMK